jgi:predicted regulator of Ras-like GTPase activity (Roadblock/LC7/MglB family)
MLTRDMVEPILQEIKKLEGVDATAVVSRDGILVGAEIPPEVHGETFAIMSATMLGAAITANSELNKNMPSKVVVESDDGMTIVAGAGINSILVVSAKGTDKSKLLKITEAAIEKIKKLE